VSASHADRWSGHRRWISANVCPSQAPKSVSRSPSSTTTSRPVRAATASAVCRARFNGELAITSIRYGSRDSRAAAASA
jgi:hypothetical protein